MKKLLFIWVLLGLAESVAFVPRAASTPSDELIVPAVDAEAPGNTFADPFFGVEPPWVTQVYLASGFREAPADIISITGLAFRVDESGGSLDTVVPRIRLTMATSNGPLDPSRLVNPIVVFDEQNVHLTASKPGRVPDFDIRIGLTQPFLYDRRTGDLVLRFESRQTSGRIQSVDSQFSGDGLLLYYEPGGFLITRAEAIVTQFTYSAIPEPSSMLFWAALVIAGPWLLNGRNVK